MPQITKPLVLAVLFLGVNVLFAQPQVTRALNAADYSTDLVPGGYISIFGSGFAAGTAQASNTPLPTTLGGASVLVGGNPIPLLFVSPGQINAQLPYGISGPMTVSVRTAAGTSTASPFTLVPNAPKFFTVSQGGTGFIVATHSMTNKYVAKGDDVATTGESITLYLNSMGEVDPAVRAGTAPGDGTTGKPLNRVVTAPVVTLDTLRANVTYAGLTPGFPGLYQVNFTTPYDDKIGDAPISVTSGAGTTQSNITLPVRGNGFYFVLTGGKSQNGQGLNGQSGNNSSLAFRHNNPSSFGPSGNNGWTKSTGLGGSYAAVAGIALTLKSGGTVVFDNNGIEAGAAGSYYASLPGSAVLFSMSTLASPTAPASTVKAIYSGYFKLASSTAVDQLTGYFEGPKNVSPPFDPANIYNTFHMNIFSNQPPGGFTFASTPKETGSYMGDVFSSDSTAGTFSYAATGTNRTTSDGTVVPTYRLVYTLKTPITLAAGEYWFSHDVSTPASDAGRLTNSKPGLPASESLGIRHLRPESTVKE